MKKVRLRKALVKDVMGVVEGLHRMNTKSACGYAFTSVDGGWVISCGEFVNCLEESTGYRYYFDFKTGKFFETV
jgi:hypothetical protein